MLSPFDSYEARGLPVVSVRTVPALSIEVFYLGGGLIQGRYNLLNGDRLVAYVLVIKADHCEHG